MSHDYLHGAVFNNISPYLVTKKQKLPASNFPGLFIQPCLRHSPSQTIYGHNFKTSLDVFRFLFQRARRLSVGFVALSRQVNLPTDPISGETLVSKHRETFTHQEEGRRKEGGTLRNQSFHRGHSPLQLGATNKERRKKAALPALDFLFFSLLSQERPTLFKVNSALTPW